MSFKTLFSGNQNPEASVRLCLSFEKNIQFLKGTPGLPCVMTRGYMQFWSGKHCGDEKKIVL